MNKEHALNRLTYLENEAKELRKIIETTEKLPEPSCEQRLWQLCQGLEFKIDPIYYPNRFFLFKGDEYYFEYDTVNGQLWCRWKYIWSVFENEYKMYYNGIQKLIKTQVEKHFKGVQVTPVIVPDGSTSFVEKHFKTTEIKNILTNE